MLASKKMSGRTSVGPYFLFVIALIAFLVFLIQRSQKPSHHWQRHHMRAETRTPPRSYPGDAEFGTQKNSEDRSCQSLGLICASSYFESWDKPSDAICSARMEHGYPTPDPRCTPGGADPSVTIEVLRNREWKTRCLRNCQTSEAQKHITYRWYGIRAPKHNSGNSQVCELDHLVPLELGGADGLGNIWPECGPNSTALEDRYFKVKDRVENYLADEVKRGRMSLQAAQRGIASDWTRYLPEANRYCSAAGRC